MRAWFVMLLATVLVGCGPTAVAARPVTTVGNDPTAAATPAETPTPSASPAVVQTVMPVPTRHAAVAPTATVARVIAAPAQRTLAVVGDSLSIGYFATTEAQAYRPLVAQRLHLRLSNQSGAYGASLANFATVSPRADVVVLEVGTNDFAQNTPLDQFRADYQDLVDRSRGQLACLGIWHWASERNSLGLAPSDYDGVIEEACARHAGRFVLLRAFCGDPSLHGPSGRSTWLGAGDEFHPNDRGHAAIADAVVSVLH